MYIIHAVLFAFTYIKHFTVSIIGAKINMTAPVLIKTKEDASLLESSVYVLSFLLPSDYQDNPPKPTNPSVSLIAIPDALYTCWYTCS